MVVPLKFTFETTLVTPRVVKQISNRINRRVGEDYVKGKILPAKFTEGIKKDLGTIYQPRSRKYEERKLRQFGHRTPWVLTGRSRQEVPMSARVTATASGGKVIIRATWSGAAKRKQRGGFARQGFTVQQRREMEAIGPRQLERMAKYAEKLWAEELADPKNLRKRRVRGSGGG